MFKNSSSKQQMLSRTANHSTRPSSRGVNLLGWDSGITEDMTPEQQYHAAVAAYKKEMDLRLKMKAGCMPVSSQAHREQGERLRQLALFISGLKASAHKKRLDDLGSYIIHLIKRRSTKSEWERLVSEAQELRISDPGCVLGKSPEKKG